MIRTDGERAIARPILKLIACLALIAPGLAQATIRKFDFTAVIQLPGSSLPNGTVVTGAFGFDDAATPVITVPGPTGASALYVDPSFFLTASFAGQSAAGSGGLGLAIDDTLDLFALVTSSGLANFGLAILDPTGAAFTGTGLPGAFPALAPGPFTDPSDLDALTVPYGIFSYDGGNVGFAATILSITPVSPVPEPASWAMMVLGFGLVGAAARRRQRRSAPLLARA